MCARLLSRRGACAASTPKFTPGGWVPYADLATPMSSDVLAGVTVAAASSALTYTGLTTSYWDGGGFNTQGQLWTQATAGNPTDGAKNLTTDYHVTSGGTEIPCSSVILVRTVVKNSGRFGLVFKSGAAMDFNLHIRQAGSGQPLKRAQARPVISAITGTCHLNVTPPSVGDWEIWCTASAYQISTALPSQTFRFVGVEHDSTSSLEPSPDTKVVIAPGDSWFHPAGAGVAHTVETYKSHGILDRLEERFGWVFARVANGGVSWATVPGSTTAVGLDYVTDGGASCIGSCTQRAIIEQIVARDGPHIIGCWPNGSYNGGSKENAIITDRVSGFAAWLAELDPNLPLLCIGIEPYQNWTVTDPTGVHNTNRLGIKAAMAAATNRTRTTGGTDGFIDPASPTAWFTGTGDEYNGGTGVQATIIGGDFGSAATGIHPNYAGTVLYGDDIYTAALSHQITAERANGVQ